MHISQPLIKQTMKKTRPRGSSDDYDKDKVFRWDSVKEHFSHNDGRLETRVMHQRDTKHNVCVKSMSASLDKVNNSLNPTARSLCSCSGDEVENVEIANQEDHLGTTQSHEPYIDSTAQEGRGDEEGDPEDKDSLGPRRVEELQAEEVAQDTLFFSCTKCNVNFEEKRHFHRHMMYHLGGHNQVNSEDVSQPFVCGECGRLFCDSNSLMSHIIIHQDRLETLMVEIKGLKNTEFKDPGRTAVQCPQCVLGCTCPKILVQRARTHDNLKHYYFCEECNYMTLTQQALEAHLRVTHLNAQQPSYRDTTRTNDAAEKLDRVQFQDKMCFFSGRDKVVLGRRQRSHCSNYTKVSDRLKVARSKPNLLTSVFGGTAHFPHCKEGVHCIHNYKENTVNSAQFAQNRLSPSLWRVDRHGKLLLQPVETLHVATDLTCVEEDTENNVWKAFGSSKQLANCPAAPDLLLSAQNLKLDQMFCQASRGLQKQEKQNAPPTRKMSTPLLKTIDNMNDDISPRLSQRLKKEFPDRELERGSSNFCSDDTSGATGSILRSSENESNPYARRYFRKRQQSFPVKDQSPQSVLKDQDNADEDCSDIEQLIIKEEYIENIVCDGSSPESPCMSPSDAFDVSPTPAVEHKPCPYCPAMFESGVGLSNHVRGHLHRVGLSYNSRHMISPEQVTSRDRQPRIRRRIPCGLRKMRKAVKPEGQGEHSCPLCWGWFDTKTGLSNHVRGHLKRMGGSVGSASSKSPLCVLNQLLQDREEHLNMLQVLNKKSQLSSSTCFVPEKITSTNGLDLKRSGIPLKIHYEIRSPHAILDSSLVPKQKAEAFSARNKLQVDAQRGTTEAPSSTLVELLQVRQELTAGYSQQAYATRTKDYMEETQVTSVGANQANGERDSNEVCFECNSPLPRLPAHLPVYTHRKRIGIIGAAGYDYKQKKPRPRPGLKKKIFPALNAEIYTLTCRFCDLVFQGPLSIQEDWIKHLQRHLLHTAVPHSGSGMVEVLGLHHKIQISMFGERPDLE